MSDRKGLAAVTGASSGIGATFARHLAARGYDLLLIARRAERLFDVARTLESNYPVRAEVLAADLTSEPDLVPLEQRLAEDPRLEILVNNAGFGTMGKFFEAPLAGQDSMHRLHVMATVRMTHAVLPGMVERRKGAVINVSSVAGFAQSPGNVSYCATKRWMNSFSEGLHLEMKSIGSPVRIQALCPGFTYSEFHDVMGVERSRIPKSWWMSSEDVVAESLRGLDEGKWLVIPGRRYRIYVWFMKWLPQSLMHSLAIRAGARFRQPKETQ